MLSDMLIAKHYLRKYKDAKERGIKFDLSFHEFKRMFSKKTCFYTGIALSIPREGENHKPTDRTIDRIDSGVGYVKGNVVLCCKVVNELKSIWENPQSILDISLVKQIVSKL